VHLVHRIIFAFGLMLSAGCSLFSQVLVQDANPDEPVRFAPPVAQEKPHAQEIDEVLNLEVKDLVDKMNVDAADLEYLEDVTVNWRKAFLEAGLFIALMNGKRAALEPWTKAGMKGPFVKDYWRSIKGSLKWKWKDGDDFFINYIRHPAEGATFAFVMLKMIRIRSIGPRADSAKVISNKPLRP